MIVKTEPLLADSGFQGHQGSPLVMMLRSQHLSEESFPSHFPIQVRIADNWEQIVHAFSDQQHGCVLIDFDTDREPTLSRLRQLRRQWFFLSVVACTEEDDNQTSFLAGQTGCVDLVQLPFRSDKLLSTIQMACNADLSGEVSRYSIRSALATLTMRESEVLHLFATGMNTKTIAKRLDVSYQTIDKHRNRALKKMNCGSLVELAIMIFGNQC